MKIAAVIFDLNGTVLDDEDEYGRAFTKVLKSLGAEIEGDSPHTRGIGVEKNWIIFLDKYHIKTNKPVEILVKETQDAYLSELSTVTVRPGFEDFTASLKESGIKIALATSNSWEVAMDVLEKVGLADIFDAMTTSEEVIYNKPDPDLFILTANKLEVERTECLVIEDAEAGITAAHRAGMKVVVLDPTGMDKSLEKADAIVGGFSEITPKLIDQLS